MKSLFNVQQWLGKTHVATVAWGKPYALAKAIKRMEELKDNPPGTYFKIVGHTVGHSVQPPVQPLIF